MKKKIRPRSRSAPTFCLLCGCHAAYLGIWAPQQQAAFLSPPGRVRTFAYALCAKHARRHGVVAEVERVLTAEFKKTCAATATN